MKIYIPKKKQEKRAKLITPFLLYLKGDAGFIEDILEIRCKYGISDQKPPLYNVPLYLLRQKYWDRDVDSMRMVNLYSPDLKEIWSRFHQDIEMIAKKYRLSNFLDLLKDYIFSGKFGSSLSIYNLTLTTDGHSITVPTDIKKKDFDKIWPQIVEFNKKYLPEERSNFQFSDAVLEKYKSVQKFDRKYPTDQIPILLFLKGELKELTEKDNAKLASLEKSQRSRLRKIAKVIFSLVSDLDKAEK